jgi:hypothetical protein
MVAAMVPQRLKPDNLLQVAGGLKACSIRGGDYRDSRAMPLRGNLTHLRNARKWGTRDSGGDLDMKQSASIVSYLLFPFFRGKPLSCLPARIDSCEWAY